MANQYYPVGLDLRGQTVLVVGGGAVAEGKIEGLIEAAAAIRLVAPEGTPRLVELAESGQVEWRRRPFEIEDVRGTRIAIAATDDRAVNAAVAAAARSAGVLVNAVDDVPNCDFIALAIVRRGDLQIAISTGGGSPAYARWLREQLEALLPEEFGPLLEILAELRNDLKSRGALPAYPVWRDAIGRSVLERLAAGDITGARSELAAALLGARVETLG